MKRFYLVTFCILPFILNAQFVDLKGAIQDAAGGQLPMANLIILPDSILAMSDLAGTYSIRVKPGLKTFHLSYTGYEPVNASMEVSHDTTLHFVLTSKVSQLDEVVVESERFSNDDLVESTRSGTNILTQKDLHNIPLFMGEADLIKTAQLLPGTVKGVEGSSDVFVRGGAADQNLVLLDGAPIYNTSHLFGFLSVFNPDIVDNVEAINGGFPAQFGGRLSSVLNVNTLSLIPDKTNLSADIGLIAARLKIEQPIVKDKASFWITARRTYVDQLAKAIGEYIPYYFSDLNGKLIVHPNRSNSIEIGHYDGSDILNFFLDKNGDGLGMVTTYNSRNSSQTFKWHHLSSRAWKNDLSLFRTDYNYKITNSFKDYRLAASSEIEDFGAKFSVEKDSIWRNTTLNAGVEWIRHEMSPNVINSGGPIAEVLESGSAPGKIAHEFALYVQQDLPIASAWRLNAGIRGSMAVIKNKTYFFPEPRLSVRYNLGNSGALKLNYSKMVQYIHRISNSTVSTPTDIWYPVTDSIKPQSSHQVSMAWQRFIATRKIYCSVEAYYKSMDNLIAYEEGTNLLFNTDFASKLIQGKGKAYGLEFLVRKDAGKFSGWISYSLSWSWRKYDEIKNGQWFHARYDRRHNGAIAAQHLIGKRWAASLVWEYISGSWFTPVTGQYLTMAPNSSGLDMIPLFADINSVKLSNSHRLDVGIKYFSKPGSKFKWNCFAGVYNAYNRATPIGVFIEHNKNDNTLKYSQPGLFGLLPFISYGCKL